MCWIFLSTSLVCVINTITQISLVTVSSTSSYMCWNVSDDPGASLRSLFPPLQFKSQQWVLSEHKTKFSQSAWPAAPGYIISMNRKNMRKLLLQFTYREISSHQHLLRHSKMLFQASGSLGSKRLFLLLKNPGPIEPKVTLVLDFTETIFHQRCENDCS